MISSRRQRTRDWSNYTAWSSVAVAVDGTLERQSQVLLARLQELAAVEGFFAGMRLQPTSSASCSETAFKRLSSIQDPIAAAAQTPLEYLLFFAIGVQA